MPNYNSPSQSRYFFGKTVLSHKGRNTTTSVGSKQDRDIVQLPNQPMRRGNVPNMFDNRPDLMSNVFYDTPGYWWYIMQANGVSDPFEQLNAGDPINIPEL